MKLNRRRVFQSLGLGLMASEAAASPADLRPVALAHGIQLSDDRLRILEPVLARRAVQLKAIRDFEIEDSVALTDGGI
jgi:hypothetical protein